MAGGLTLEQKQILTTVNVGASALSFAGSAFIVLCYLLFRELRKFSFKLIFYLALSDMFCSFFNILGDPGKGFFCYAQGYSTHFFCVASFLWTTTIAFTLHRTVVRHKTDVEELGAIFHLYVWGSSLVMTIIPSIGNEYGQAGAWCWVQTTARAGKGLFNSIAYGLNASVRRTLQEKIDLYWPDRFRKWLPSFINIKDRSYESELIPFKVPDDQRNAV